MKSSHADSARRELDRLAGAGLGWQEFATQGLEVLGRAVPFDGACLGTLDPATNLITGSVKVGIPDADEVSFAQHEYLHDDVSLFTDLATRRMPVSILNEETGGDPLRSSRIRELFHPAFGFGDEIRSALQIGTSTWGGLGIYREGPHGGFSPAEADFVHRVSESLAVGLRAGLIAAAAHSVTTAVVASSRFDVEFDSPPDGPAVIVVGEGDRIVQATHTAERRVAQLGGDLWSDLPPALAATLAGARALVAGVAHAVPRVTARSSTGDWLIVQAAPLGAARAGRTEIVVTIDRAAPAEIIPILVAAWGLTDRERDVTTLVLRGNSTAEISKRLHLSSYTVQDHLKVVFGKAGVASRRELVSAVFFNHYAERVGGAIGHTGWFAGR